MASRGKLADCFTRLDDSGADKDLIELTKDCLELEPADRPRDAGILAVGKGQGGGGQVEAVDA